MSVTFQRIFLKIYSLKLLETILIKEGKACHLFYHQQRLERSYKELFKQESPFNLQSLISPPDTQTYRCRFIYDEKEWSAEYIPYTPSFKKELFYKEIDFTYEHKLLNRDRILEHTKELNKASDVIFVKNGLICDTSIANIACKIEGSWLTPKSPLHEGTTRARLLDEKKLQIADITVKQCQNAQSIALFNALTGFYELD